MDSNEYSGNGAHEIITLQLGNYSNFVGAHFFNLQVIYNSLITKNYKPMS